VAEVLRFADPSPVRFEDAGSLPSEGFEADIVVVDEAATMPVAWLRDMVQRHPRAHLVFCTTVHGYEGTGRGFMLRFRPWLDGLDRPVTHLTLTQPIRWEAGDPLEDWLFGLLALDARPGKWSAGVVAPLVVERVPSGVLADDESLLRQVFGLLVQAHYRTTPSDLLRMLDAPNVSVHVARRGDLVVGATLVAREGGLTPEACEAIWRGATRVRGHALADTLVSHAGVRDAGQLHMVRSVRIATHPGLRRAGIGRRLVEHVHQTYQADLYGTMFGVTEAVIGFRRTLGYEVVRLGAARSARTGEPSVVMLRAAHPGAQRWITQLRRQLAWDLPAQVMFWQAERVGAPSEALVASLSRGLGAPVPPSSQEMSRLLGRYVRGHLTFEGAVATLLHVLDGRWERVAAAAGRDAEAVAWRLRHRRGWLEVMARTGLPSVPATMRSVRRGLAAALEALGVEA
jgi:tRNA(Met) cytidine acetyltransferase